MVDNLTPNQWTWRRPLIWLLSISGFILAAWIVLQLGKFGEASIQALEHIALGALLESTIIVTLYILGAGQEYVKLIEASIKAFDFAKDK